MSIEKAYNEWSSQYDSNKNRTRDLDGKLTREVLIKLDFNSVLELGCGTGKNTVWFQEKAGHILAVDFSEEMLKLAKEKVNPEIVNFKKVDITEPWDWTSDRFDLISCNLVLEHIKDLDFIFQHVSLKLEQGGHFFISELHPFKQYLGSKARFETENGTMELSTFTHHISDFLEAAVKTGFELEKLNEWFDEEGKTTPRILSLLFKKS